MFRRSYETAPSRTWRLEAQGLALALVAGCTITTVEPVMVEEITVAPSRLEALVTDEVTLSAELRDREGNQVTGRPVTWASLDETVASVDGSGLVRLTGPGETFVTATVDGAVGVAEVVSRGGPELRVAQARIELRTTIGGKTPDKREVRVTNSGSGVLSDLTTHVAYQGRSGWLTAELSSPSTPATLTLRAMTNALPAGDHEATVRVRGRYTEAAVRVVYKVRQPD
ncbi:MAG: hypothetical protein HKO53_05460 [Gemmatimonadetes bacterium]|nr:hypothetical protein [Gemmatimonadota bacterium]